MARSALQSRGGQGGAHLWRANRPVGTAEGVYGRIKGRILRIELEPGRALSEPELAMEYGVSRTPIREALIRLADEGLVDIIPKSGTIVAKIVPHLLPEAILVRKALEDVTTRHAAERASGSDLLRLQACILRQEEVAAAADYEAFHLADEEFHATVAEIAGFPGIWTLVERAKMHVDRYRRLTLPIEGRMERVIREHRLVLDGISRHDPNAASDAMSAHIAGLEITIDKIRNEHPTYFSGGLEHA